MAFRPKGLTWTQPPAIRKRLHRSLSWSKQPKLPKPNCWFDFKRCLSNLESQVNQIRWQTDRQLYFSTLDPSPDTTTTTTHKGQPKQNSVRGILQTEQKKAPAEATSRSRRKQEVVHDHGAPRWSADNPPPPSVQASSATTVRFAADGSKEREGVVITEEEFRALEAQVRDPTEPPCFPVELRAAVKMLEFALAHPLSGKSAKVWNYQKPNRLAAVRSEENRRARMRRRGVGEGGGGGRGGDGEEEDVREKAIAKEGAKMRYQLAREDRVVATIEHILSRMKTRLLLVERDLQLALASSTKSKPFSKHQKAQNR
ncbi:hypothetical protein CBR_g49996 [Chara braunii]|uniref:Uncharacterized protein n=1 Tax=Chara braunii TaxID=69332 RepID=A0A388K574_CHABU|nr:hypothetical protein CBR_g49996 [Chara braunii]|eukprot:GBG65204.1 hypothetical protein CBR_g49996 [Chara braunii]